MNLDPSLTYHYTSGGQQYGPADVNQLIELARQGLILPQDSLWAEGFPEWVSVSGFPELASGATSATGAVGASSAASLNVGESAKVGMTKVDLNLRPQVRQRARASFGKLVLWFVLGMACYGGWFGTFAAGTTTPEGEFVPGIPIVVTMLLGLFSFVFFVLWAVGNYVVIYRAWAHIEEMPGVRTTAGKAVGFLFIPFFNLFWIFIAIGSWAEEFNRYLEFMGADHVKRASPALGLVHCVLSLLGLPILFPFVIWEMCSAINAVAPLPAPVYEDSEAG